MKKKVTAFLLTALLAICSFAIVACDQACVVTFYTDGGTAITAQTVEAGQKAEKPADPTKDGFTFDKWILADGTAYSFDTPVATSFTLIAKWNAIAAKHIVSFYTDGGTAIEGVEVVNGQKVAEPTAPTREGYEFVEWILPDGTAYDFDTAVTAPTTLIAKWNALFGQFDVTFAPTTGVTFTPVTEGKVKEGNDFSFTVTLGAAFSDSVIAVKAGNEVLLPVEGVYTVRSVKEDVEVSVTGVERNMYEITLPEADGVAFITEGDNSFNPRHGDTVEFSIELDAKYSQNAPAFKLFVDGDELIEEEGVYTIETVTKNMEITVTLPEENVYEVVLPENGDHYSFAAVEGYKLTGIAHGAEFKFEIIAAEHYGVENVVVKMGDEVLEAVNGVYTVIVEDDLTFTAQGAANVVDTVTITFYVEGATFTSEVPYGGTITSDMVPSYAINDSTNYTNAGWYKYVIFNNSGTIYHSVGDAVAPVGMTNVTEPMSFIHKAYKIINTPEAFMDMVYNDRLGTSITMAEYNWYTITADIDFAGYDDVRSYGSTIRGKLLGNNHKIKNLTMKMSTFNKDWPNSTQLAVLGSVGAEGVVNNLTFENLTLIVDNNKNATVGLFNSISGTVENVNVINGKIIANQSSDPAFASNLANGTVIAGGLACSVSVGQSYVTGASVNVSPVIRNCVVMMEIEADRTETTKFHGATFGGLANNIQVNGTVVPVIEDVYVIGDITAKAYGGVVSGMFGNTTNTVKVSAVATTVGAGVDLSKVYVCSQNSYVAEDTNPATAANVVCNKEQGTKKTYDELVALNSAIPAFYRTDLPTSDLYTIEEVTDGFKVNVIDGVTMKDTDLFKVLNNGVAMTDTEGVYALPTTGWSKITVEGVVKCNYEVRFDLGPATAIESKIVAYKATVEEPADPTADGFEWNGWFVDGVEYDFETPVTADITISTKWTRLLASATDFGAMVADLTAGKAYDYKMTADIDLTGAPALTTVGGEFNAKFDGQGHTIKNLTVADTAISATADNSAAKTLYRGLFDVVSGTFQNVIFDGLTVPVTVNTTGKKGGGFGPKAGGIVIGGGVTHNVYAGAFAGQITGTVKDVQFLNTKFTLVKGASLSYTTVKFGVVAGAISGTVQNVTVANTTLTNGLTGATGVTATEVTNAGITTVNFDKDGADVSNISVANGKISFKAFKVRREGLEVKLGDEALTPDVDGVYTVDIVNGMTISVKGTGAAQYLVKLVSAYGDLTQDTFEINENGYVDDPELEHAVYDLVGWFNGTEEWDFAEDKVTADVTLTAKWQYVIDTADKFVAMKDHLNAGIDFILGDDLNLTGKTVNVMGELKTTFAGNGHKVSNLTVTSASTSALSIGLFTLVSGKVENVVFENFKLSITDKVANGTSKATKDFYIGNLASELTGTVENVAFEDYLIEITSTAGSATSDKYHYYEIGGIAGKATKAVITDVLLDGKIFIHNIVGYNVNAKIGGVIEYSDKTETEGVDVTTITNAYVSTTINAQFESPAGCNVNYAPIWYEKPASGGLPFGPIIKKDPFVPIGGGTTEYGAKITNCHAVEPLWAIYSQYNTLGSNGAGSSGTVSYELRDAVKAAYAANELFGSYTFKYNYVIKDVPETTAMGAATNTFKDVAYDGENITFKVTCAANKLAAVMVGETEITPVNGVYTVAYDRSVNLTIEVKVSASAFKVQILYDGYGTNVTGWVESGKTITDGFLKLNTYEPLGTVADPTHADLTFKGWYTSREYIDANKIENINTYVVEAALNVYARWALEVDSKEDAAKIATYTAKSNVEINLLADLDYEGGVIPSFGDKIDGSYNVRFFGNGHKISNGHIDVTTGATGGNYGLFGYIQNNAIVKDLILENVTVNATVATKGGITFDRRTGAEITNYYDANIGVLAGWIVNENALSNIAIKGCKIVLTSSEATYANVFAGGLAGNLGNTTVISDVFVDVAISGAIADTETSVYAALVAGNVGTATVTLTNVYAYGKLAIAGGKRSKVAPVYQVKFVEQTTGGGGGRDPLPGRLVAGETLTANVTLTNCHVAEPVVEGAATVDINATLTFETVANIETALGLVEGKVFSGYTFSSYVD